MHSEDVLNTCLVCNFCRRLSSLKTLCGLLPCQHQIRPRLNAVIVFAARGSSNTSAYRSTDNSKQDGGGSVMVVESPTKAQKIQQFLGDNYTVGNDRGVPQSWWMLGMHLCHLIACHSWQLCVRMCVRMCMSYVFCGVLGGGAN